MNEIYVFIRSLFNISDIDMYSMLWKKKSVFGTLSCAHRAATTLVSYAPDFSHRTNTYTHS